MVRKLKIIKKEFAYQPFLDPLDNAKKENRPS